MTNRHWHCPNLSLLVIGALSAGLSYGQSFNAQHNLSPEQNTDNWYQVEMLVFERVNPIRHIDNSETWSKHLALAYPPNWKELRDRVPLEEALSSEKAISNGEAPGNGGTSDKKIPPNKEPVSNADTLPQVEEPFIRLSSEDWQQGDVSKRIERDRSLRLLFHEAWRQPMHKLEEASAIIIHGGQQYGDHFELEGSVTLSISRYLHLSTNLWLTQFKANYGQASEHWPRLPSRPQYIDINKITDSQAPEEELSLSGTQFGMENKEENLFGGNLLSLDSTELSTTELGATDTTNTNTWAFQNDSGDGYSNLVNEPYIISQIVHMKQKRRMRSEELHYLDHPRLGIIVKLSKYNPLENQIGKEN